MRLRSVWVAVGIVVFVFGLVWVARSRDDSPAKLQAELRLLKARGLPTTAEELQAALPHSTGPYAQPLFDEAQRRMDASNEYADWLALRYVPLPSLDNSGGKYQALYVNETRTLEGASLAFDEGTTKAALTPPIDWSKQLPRRPFDPPEANLSGLRAQMAKVYVITGDAPRALRSIQAADRGSALMLQRADTLGLISAVVARRQATESAFYYVLQFRNNAQALDALRSYLKSRPKKPSLRLCLAGELLKIRNLLRSEKDLTPYQASNVSVKINRTGLFGPNPARLRERAEVYVAKYFRQVLALIDAGIEDDGRYGPLIAELRRSEDDAAQLASTLVPPIGHRISVTMSAQYYVKGKRYDLDKTMAAFVDGRWDPHDEPLK